SGIQRASRGARERASRALREEWRPRGDRGRGGIRLRRGRTRPRAARSHGGGIRGDPGTHSRAGARRRGRALSGTLDGDDAGVNVLVTGGCGFIGTHAAMRFSTLGHRVTLLDDLSRPGAEANLAWLRGGYACAFVRADVT